MADSLAPQAEKAPWQSKTMWVSALTVLAPLVYPPAAAWISAHPELFSAALGAVFSALRVVTKSKVSIG